jgi:acyl transferase domain-containing protein/acyl carrier protein
VSDPNLDPRALLARALARIDAQQAELTRLRGQAQAPIAILGAACRVPGASSPEEMFAALLAGRDLVGPIPPGRLYGAWPEGAPRFAGLLDGDPLAFDPGFFGMSQAEAERVDPQQRMALELCWEALERAGLAPDGLRGASVGVFIAQSTADYSEQLHDAVTGTPWDLTGAAPSVTAGRVAHLLGLRGPAITLDTACSGSLVAVHLAAQSLRAGDCSLALAGGVQLLGSATLHGQVAQTSALAPDGRCRTFDASASGFVRGEGGGVVVLKRLADAQRDGDEIWAVLRGSAINHDGASPGLTVPSVAAQEALLRLALSRSGLRPDDLDLVETHGTGTPMGDPIEVEALRAVFGGPRSDGRPLWLGAVKTQLGHLEAAAGVTGLLKVVMSLRAGRVPPNLHLRHLNPRLRLQGTPLTPLTEAQAWPSRPDRARAAGVSSFGLSGTNAHAVVEEAPRRAPPSPRREGRPTSAPILLSARDEAGLRAQAARLGEWARSEAGAALDLGDLAWSLTTSRSQGPRRAAVRVSDLAELAPRLEAWARGERSRGDYVGEGRPRPLAFLFTGQGSVRPGMGRGLYAAFPAFRAAFDEVIEALGPDLRLREVMFAEPGSPEAERLGDTALAQPALFTFGVALARLWIQLGVRPAAVFGHSLGELTASCVAGAISLEHAARLVVERARLMAAVKTPGGMVSVEAPAERVAALIVALPGVEIACFNGPNNTVITGAPEALAQAVARLEDELLTTTPLRVRQAFHSAHLDGVVAPLTRLAKSLALTTPTIPLVSGLTGAFIPQPSAESLAQQVRAPVRFEQGLRALAAEGITTFVELGPRPALTALGGATLGREAWMIPGIIGEDEVGATLGALAAAWAGGAAVDWRAALAPLDGRRVSLPTTAFVRRPCALEVPPRGERRPKKSAPTTLVEIAATQHHPKPPLDLIRWRLHDAPRPTGPRRPGRWLLLAEETGVTTRLERALEGRGAQVVRVEAAAPGRPPSGWRVVSPHDADALRAMAQKVTASRPLDGVVSLWGLGAETLSQAPDAVRALITLAETLAASPNPPRLIVVTRPGAVAQRALAEATSALRERLPILNLLQVTLAGASPQDEVQALAEELIAGAKERRVWLEGPARRVQRAERVGRAPGPNEGLVALGEGAGLLRPEGEEWALWCAPVAPVAGAVALRVDALAPLGARAVVRGVVVSSGEAVVGVSDTLSVGHSSLPATALRPAPPAASPAAILGAWLARRALSALSWGPDAPGVILGRASPAAQVLLRHAEAAGVRVFDEAPTPGLAPRWLVNTLPERIPDVWRGLLSPGATLVELGGAAPLDGPFSTLRVHPESLLPGPALDDALAEALTFTPTTRSATSFGARLAQEITLGDGPLALTPGAPELGGPWWVTASTSTLQAEAAGAVARLGGALATTLDEAQAHLHVEGGEDALEDVVARLTPLTEASTARRFAVGLGGDTPLGAAALGLLEAVVHDHGGVTLFCAAPVEGAQDLLITALCCLDAPSGLRLLNASAALTAHPDDPAWAALAPPAPARPSLAQTLAALPQDEALALLCARLEHHLSGLCRGGAVNLDAPIADLGVDSLTALELLNTLHAELGVRLPMATLLEATSARALAATLLHTVHDPDGA